MIDSDVRPSHVTRGALTAAMISAGFGASWALWGASGLGGGAGFAVGAIGVVVGLAIVFAALRARPHAAEDDGSTFRSRPYRLIVMAEFAALIVGSVALGSTGHNEYVPVWYATVVGVHFVAFGRVFWTGFMAVGGALLVAAGAGLGVGVSGGSDGSIAATTGLMAAAVLLAAGTMTISNARKG